MHSIQHVIESILETRFFKGDDAPLSATFHPGSENSPALVVAGANASGKSYMVRLIASWLRAKASPKIEPIQVSMRYRAGLNVQGMQRLMMFGNEDDSSTGYNSVGAIFGAIRTSEGRDTPHYVLFDEPDIGLAEEYAIPAGEHMGNFAVTESDHRGGVALISHSKPLVRAFMKGLGHQPHFLYMDGTTTLDEWLNTTAVRSIADLLSLRERANERWKRIEAFESKGPVKASS